MLTVSAPGSLMIAGEHAVLHKRKALVMAINRRLSVHIKAQTEAAIIINSCHGQKQYPLPLEQLDLSCWQDRILHHFKDNFHEGYQIEVLSSIATDQGLGSSGAFIVTFYKAIYESIHSQTLSGHALWQACLTLTRQYQSLASGCDLAASIWAGMLLVDPRTETFQKLPHHPNWLVAYTGYKTKTADVIEQVKNNYSESLWDLIESQTNTLTKSFASEDMTCAGQAMNTLYQSQQSLGVSCARSDKLWEIMQHCCYGAKLSGAGLGDCMLGLLKTTPSSINLRGFTMVNCQLSQQGLSL